MSYIRLTLNQPRPLIFALTNALFSSLGQTHLISLFTPYIIVVLGLSNAEYGSLYSLATLASGLMLPFFGPLIDRKDLRFFCVGLGLGLIACELLLVSSSWFPAVFLAFFGLRLIGQGLCSQVCGVATARYFDQDRGKALSITTLGFPIGEGLLAPLVAYMLTLYPWQNVSLALAVLVFVIYLPTVLFITKGIGHFNRPFASSANKNQKQETSENNYSWTRREVFTNSTIYWLLPQSLIPPFALTGIFFHQGAIASLRGWTMTHMASGLLFFALSRSLTGFATGPLVDKYKAVRLFPFYLIPMVAGLLTLAIFDGLWSPFVAFACFGFAVGAGGPIKSAIWAELYGTLHLGAIKSTMSTIMVISTAVSPALFGYILDIRQEPLSLLWTLAGMTLAFALMSGFHLLPRVGSKFRPGT